MREYQVLPLDDRPLRELIGEHGATGLFAQNTITRYPDSGHVPYPSGVTGSHRNIDVIAF